MATSHRARSIMIASPEGSTGKSLVALGLIERLVRSIGTVGVFRPVVTAHDGRDQLGERLVNAVGDGEAVRLGIGVTYDDVHADADAALATIINRYKSLEEQCNFTVIVGSDYTDVAGPTEFSFNGKIAANLGAPVILVASGLQRTPADIAQVVDIAVADLAQSHATTVGIVANRCDPTMVDAIATGLGEGGLPSWALPEVPFLSAPLVAEVAVALDAELRFGAPALMEREAQDMLVCAMTVEHVLDRLRDGQLCIVAGDRADVLIALVAAHTAKTAPSLAGIVLNGGFTPTPQVDALIRTLDAQLPIMCTHHASYETARIVASTRGRMATGTQRKLDLALATFEEHIDADSFLKMLDVPQAPVVTPLMFEWRLIEQARQAPRHIVLPEGDEARVLQATSTLLTRKVTAITLLGNERSIIAKAASLGVDISGAQIIDPRHSDMIEAFAHEYAMLRAHKGMTVDVARDLVRDVSYFGTMMVQLGYADGMVSGATHSTAHTITPAFEIIKTAPGVGKVSSVFFMCLPDRVLVYGDAAVIPDPTAEELADIAIASADTARRFGITPRVAMLSYATGESGSGVDVDKVRAATERVKELRPDIEVEGPMQYDAAIDPNVAATKLPESTVAGRATVFVFPDLDAGNNTYKAVQRSAGAVAIGPVLQGLRKPVNDLSRGATVRDIINTVAITAAQAPTGARAHD